MCLFGRNRVVESDQTEDITQMTRRLRQLETCMRRICAMFCSGNAAAGMRRLHMF